MKRILLFTLLGTLGLHAAIRSGDAAAPAAKPSATQPTPAPKVERGLEDLLKQAPREGGAFRIDSQEFQDFLRNMLEGLGVPKEELKDQDLFGLLRKLREKTGAETPNPGPSSELDDLLNFQMDRKLADKLNDHFRQLLDGHRPGTVQAAPATYPLRDSRNEKEAVAFGTGVRADGWLLTKASEVNKIASLQCRVNGAWVPAKVVRVWDDHDLALVKVPGQEIAAIKWASSADPNVGTLITAVAPPGQEPIALGVVSVAARNLQSKGRGFLGVQLDTDEQGLKIREVIAGGAALSAGVQKDDRVLEIDGQKPDSIFTFTRMVSDRKAGEKVKLKLQRGSTIIEKEIQLGDRGAQAGMVRQGNNRLNGMGSTISKRRDNFTSVIQTDLPLEANQCGGPVTDLDGNAVGLVIARSGRIETLIIPASAIRETLAAVDFAKEEAVAKSDAKK